MTTRLQTLSVSHEQKVIALRSVLQLHSSNRPSSWAANQVRQPSANTERDDFDPVCHEELNVGSRTGLQLRNEGRKQHRWWKIKLYFRLNETRKTLARGLTSNITFLQFFSFSICFGVSESIGARGGVRCACLNASLSQLFMPCCSLWKARLDPSRNKNLCCLCQLTDLCSSARST